MWRMAGLDSIFVSNLKLPYHLNHLSYSFRRMAINEDNRKHQNKYYLLTNERSLHE
jgi:hypothetical protein